jgi:hypothetical protein
MLGAARGAVHRAGVQVDVRHIERHHLADAHACGIQQLEQGAVALAVHRRVFRGRLQQALDLALADRGGQILAHLGRVQVGAGVLVDGALVHQEAKERLGGSHLASDGCRGVLMVVSQAIDVVIEMPVAHLWPHRNAGATRQKVGKLAQVVAIGDDGVVRVPLLVAQRGQECLDLLTHAPTLLIGCGCRTRGLLYHHFA